MHERIKQLLAFSISPRDDLRSAYSFSPCVQLLLFAAKQLLDYSNQSTSGLPLGAQRRAYVRCGSARLGAFTIVSTLSRGPSACKLGLTRAYGGHAVLQGNGHWTVKYPETVRAHGRTSSGHITQKGGFSGHKTFVHVAPDRGVCSASKTSKQTALDQTALHQLHGTKLECKIRTFLKSCPIRSPMLTKNIFQKLSKTVWRPKVVQIIVITLYIHKLFPAGKMLSDCYRCTEKNTQCNIVH